MPSPKPKLNPAASKKAAPQAPKMQPVKPAAPQTPAGPAGKTTPSAGIPNFSGTPTNMNGHAAIGVPNRAGEPRGQMTNVGTSYRYSDPSGLTPANPKPNVSNNLAQVTSTPSAPKISAKEANTRDVRLERENNARNAANENKSYQSSVEKSIKTFKNNEYRTSNPGVNRYPNGTTPRATVVGGNPKYINGNVEGPSLKSGGFKGAKGGILGAVPALLDGGKIWSGQSTTNTIPKWQREG